METSDFQKEQFETQQSVHYWAGRLLGHEQAYDIAQEIVEAIAYASLQCAEMKEEITKLQKFKDYVHNRLDKMGIPVDPESPHKAAGCRIGGRLDVIQHHLISALEDNSDKQRQISQLQEEVERLNQQRELAHKYIVALNDYHQTIKGENIRWDKTLYDVAEQVGNKYAESLLSSGKESKTDK